MLSILKGSNIGIKLIGGTCGITASCARAMKIYKMAFAAYVKGEKGANDLSA